MKCFMLGVWVGQHDENVAWHFYLGFCWNCFVTEILSVPSFEIHYISYKKKGKKHLINIKQFVK